MDEENNQVAFVFIISHYRAKMKMKLEVGSDFLESIEDNQDGVGLMKALHDIHFGKDGAKQGIHEVVCTAKHLHVCFQGCGAVTGSLHAGI